MSRADMAPRSVTSFRLCSSDDAAAVCFHRASSQRPHSSNTQWLSFRFRSAGLFAHSPFSHFAVVLRAHLGLDDAGVPCSISGRGMTLGDTSAAFMPEGACSPRQAEFGGARGMQIESFWPGGNFLWRDTGRFAAGLQDDVEYHVQLHVNDQSWIAFTVDVVGEGDEVHRTAAQVLDCDSHPVRADATGVLIALARDARETGPWSATFEALEWGWF